MAIFDGHNDLLRISGSHHREDPVSAFSLPGLRTAISTILACCKADLPAGYSRYSCHRRNILPV